MCDEYHDERMMAFWRRLEELERQERSAPEDEATVDPVVRIVPIGPAAPRDRPRTLTH